MHTHLEAKPCIQAHRTTVLDNLLCCAESVLPNIAAADRMVVYVARHRDLLSQDHSILHELEWSFRIVNIKPLRRRSGLYSLATNVDKAPAVAPATPKQVMVPRSGKVPGLFTTESGSSPPVTCPMKAEVLYFAF